MCQFQWYRYQCGHEIRVRLSTCLANYLRPPAVLHHLEKCNCDSCQDFRGRSNQTGKPLPMCSGKPDSFRIYSSTKCKKCFRKHEKSIRKAAIKAAELAKDASIEAWYAVFHQGLNGEEGLQLESDYLRAERHLDRLRAALIEDERIWEAEKRREVEIKHVKYKKDPLYCSRKRLPIQVRDLNSGSPLRHEVIFDSHWTEDMDSSDLISNSVRRMDFVPICLPPQDAASGDMEVNPMFGYPLYRCSKIGR